MRQPEAEVWVNWRGLVSEQTQSGCFMDVHETFSQITSWTDSVADPRQAADDATKSVIQEGVKSATVAKIIANESPASKPGLFSPKIFGENSRQSNGLILTLGVRLLVPIFAAALVAMFLAALLRSLPAA
jgi:hypothetical protein